MLLLVLLSSPGTSQASMLGTGLWRPRPKREEVLVPDWILAEGCHVENCAELTGREAPESNRNASYVRIRAPLLLTDPSPGRIRFPGGKEVPVSSTELRNHLANMLCCLVNEITHITDRAARSKMMSSFYENIMSWIEELLIPALGTQQYVSVEERNAVSRLAKDLGVLQQGKYVPAFYLDVTEAREREEERLHLQAIGMIVVCSVGSVLLTLGLLFCVLMARGKKKAVARSQGEMEPLLDAVGAGAAVANATSTEGDGTTTTQNTSLGQAVVSRARMGPVDAGYVSGQSNSGKGAMVLRSIFF